MYNEKNHIILSRTTNLKTHMNKKLYIRHADKLYANEKGFPLHDPPIKDCVDQIESSARTLLYFYGVPSVICTSPFERARQTAEIIKRLIWKEYGIEVEIVIDILISEYLGNRRQDVEVKKETDQYNFPIEDNINQFIERVQNHLIESSTRFEYSWNITHGIVINMISKIKRTRKKGNINFLEGLLIEGRKITILKKKQ